MKEIILEDKDRLVLVNQYKILSLLDKTEEKERYLKAIKILESGYEILYDSLLEDFAPSLSKEDCQFVYNVLEMYGNGIICSFNNLSEHKSLKKEDVRFPGFNDKDEVYLYHFTLYLFEDKGFFDEIQEISNNNYKGIGPTRERYAKMIKKRKSFNNGTLSEEQIKELIDIY